MWNITKGYGLKIFGNSFCIVFISIASGIAKMTLETIIPTSLTIILKFRLDTLSLGVLLDLSWAHMYRLLTHSNIAYSCSKQSVAPTASLT